MAEVRFDPELVEEVVFAFMRTAAGEEDDAAWNGRREAIYAYPDPGQRERAFRDLSGQWFRRLRLDEPIRFALEACPWIRRRITVLQIRRAMRPREEASELYCRDETGWSDAEPVRLSLNVCVKRFLDPDGLRELALRELLHAEDMLDPDFAYRPFLPPELDEDIARRELVRDRFSVLWEARIEARLDRILGREERALPTPRFARAFGKHVEDPELTKLRARARSVEGTGFDDLLDTASTLVPSRTSFTS